MDRVLGGWGGVGGQGVVGFSEFIFKAFFIPVSRGNHGPLDWGACRHIRLELNPTHCTENQHPEILFKGIITS